MSFELVLLGLVLAGISISFYYCFVTGISPVSSTRSSRKKILSTVPINQKGTIYELGAGWGALAFPLAGRCPSAKVVAYELSPVPWLFMRLRSIVLGPRNLKILRRNFLNDNLGNADLVVFYLHPQALAKLAPKLDKELTRNTRVISNTFEMPDWKPSRVEEIEDLMCPEIFYYRSGPAADQLKEAAALAAEILENKESGPGPSRSVMPGGPEKKIQGRSAAVH